MSSKKHRKKLKKLHDRPIICVYPDGSSEPHKLPKRIVVIDPDIIGNNLKMFRTYKEAKIALKPKPKYP